MARKPRASKSSVVVTVATDTPTPDTSIATVAPKTTVATAEPVASPAVPLGAAGTLPVGMAELFDAALTVNASVVMTPEAIRADVATVRALVENSLGDRPMPPKNRGRFTGLRTYDFQNTLFAVNDREGLRVSDRTLAIMWAVELPSNRCDFTVHPTYVGSTRTAYRHGRHGSNIIDPTDYRSTVWPVVPAK